MEFFLRRGNTIVPSQGIVKGTKAHPFELEHGVTHRDNVLCEIGMEPADNPEDFVRNIRLTMEALQNEILDPFDVVPHIVPSYILQPEQLYHPEANRVGCDPDFNCYTGEENPTPSLIRAGNFRCGSGHIHASFECKGGITPYTQRVAARSMDRFVGLQSVRQDLEGMARKNKLYGKAGAYRPKPYGIEYRVPSNWWLRNAAFQTWIFRHTKAAIVHAEWAESRLTQAMADDITDTINRGSFLRASRLVEELGLISKMQEIT